MREVKYTAEDRKAGMTAEELRRAFANAVDLVAVEIGNWGKKIKSVTVREQ